MPRPVDPLEPRELVYFDEASPWPDADALNALPEPARSMVHQMREDMSRMADNVLSMAQAIGHLRERIAQLEARQRKPGIDLAPPPLIGLNS